MSVLDEAKIHLVQSVDDAFELTRWLSTVESVAIDCETTGLSPETDRVRLFQIGDARTAWVLRADRWAGVLKDVVRRYQGRWVGHNLPFDVAMIRASLGIQLPLDRCDDTRVACHILEPTLATGLKAAADRHVDPRASKFDRQLQQAFASGKWTWATVPLDFEPYWQYAGVDVLLTSALRDVLLPRVHAEAPRAYQLELATEWVCERVARNGVAVDRELARTKLTEFEAYCVEVERWCEATYGVKPGSNGKVVEVLQEAGCEFTVLTESGAAYALDKEVLSRIDHPLAQAVLSRRQLQKLGSTYLKHYVEDGSPDGRLHPRINSMGARTGRMTMEAPSFHNLPRQSDANPAAQVIRRCVVADEGHTLVLADFDQIEARILAHLARDSGLAQAFQGDVDFFTRVAREVHADPTLGRSDHRRQSTKNTVYARSYGAGVQKIALTAGITVEQASQFMQRFDQLYPGVRQFELEVARVAEQRRRDEGRAYVRSSLTGRPHFAEAEKEYVLVNSLIQGMAAEVFKLKCCELAAAGLDQYLTLLVHDEVGLDVPNEELEEVLVEVQRVMNDATLLDVPITAHAAVGTNWADKRDVQVPTGQPA